MTPRVATNNTSEKDTLTEAETLSLADLKVKDRAGLLTDTSERLRYKSLLAAQPDPATGTEPRRTGRHRPRLPGVRGQGPEGVERLHASDHGGRVARQHRTGPHEGPPADGRSHISRSVPVARRQRGVRPGQTAARAAGPGPCRHHRRGRGSVRPADDLHPAAVEVAEAASTTTGTKPEAHCLSSRFRVRLSPPPPGCQSRLGHRPTWTS
jgi:hypothetical protein